MEARWRWQFWVMRPKQAREPFLHAMWRAVFPLSSTRHGSQPAFKSFSTNWTCSVITARWRAVWGEGFKKMINCCVCLELLCVCWRRKCSAGCVWLWLPVSGGSGHWGRDDRETVWSSEGHALRIHEWWPSGEACREKRERGIFKIVLLKKEYAQGKWFQSNEKEQSLSSGAFRKNGVLSGYFHQLWLDTSDALSVTGIGPGTFLNAQRGL